MRREIQERFPGDAHRQIYYAWREFPLAMRLTMWLGYFIGVGVSLLVYAGVQIVKAAL